MNEECREEDRHLSPESRNANTEDTAFYAWWTKVTKLCYYVPVWLRGTCGKECQGEAREARRRYRAGAGAPGEGTVGSRGSLRAGHEGRGVLRWDPFSWSGELGSGECGLLGALKPGPGSSEGQGRGQQMPHHAALARAVPPKPASAQPI